MSAVALGLRVLAAARSGALVVHRPRGVAHLYVGPTTASGVFVPAAGRPLCGASTRRLSVLQPRTPSSGLGLGGRRFCRRCTSDLGPSLGRDVQRLVTREEWIAAYSHLTVSDFVTAGRWCRTVAETHQVGMVASMVHGPTSFVRPKVAGPDLDLFLMHVGITARRRALEVASRTPEQQAAIDATREDRAYDQARIANARREQDRINRALDRRAGGGYLTPYERELVTAS